VLRKRITFLWFLLINIYKYLIIFIMIIQRLIKIWKHKMVWNSLTVPNFNSTLILISNLTFCIHSYFNSNHSPNHCILETLIHVSVRAIAHIRQTFLSILPLLTLAFKLFRRNVFQYSLTVFLLTYFSCI
jgi:hypothetical protein